MYTLVTHMVCP